jgi:hypothetical protein
MQVTLPGPWVRSFLATRGNSSLSFFLAPAGWSSFGYSFGLPFFVSLVMVLAIDLLYSTVYSSFISTVEILRIGI